VFGKHLSRRIHRSFTWNIYHYHKIKLLTSTFKLKEKKRIQEAGGFVSMNGVWRVQGVLATSRALGDYPLKDRKVVVSEPDVLSFQLSKEPHLRPEFAILVTINFLREIWTKIMPFWIPFRHLMGCGTYFLMKMLFHLSDVISFHLEAQSLSFQLQKIWLKKPSPKGQLTMSLWWLLILEKCLLEKVVFQLIPKNKISKWRTLFSIWEPRKVFDFILNA